jgi:hypothetical protein
MDIERELERRIVLLGIAVNLLITIWLIVALAGG